MALGRLRYRLQERRLPRVFTITDFDPAGVKFEVTNMVERHRVVNHGDETEYTAAMLSSLRADDVVFDIGANVGLVALHAARRCRTIAFEPDPGFAERLAANLRLNPDIALDVHALAVSDREATVLLYTEGVAGNSPSLVPQRGEQNAVEVPARSLDDLVLAEIVPHPTVLKLDIEGAEILALRGAERLLQSPRRPRAVFIEVHETFLPAFGSSADEVMSVLDGAGYSRVTYRAPRADQNHLILEQAV